MALTPLSSEDLNDLAALMHSTPEEMEVKSEEDLDLLPSEPFGVSPLAPIDTGHPYAELRAMAENLDDLIRLRVGLDNRMGRAKIDADLFSPARTAIGNAEKFTIKELKTIFARTCPELVAWANRTRGVGVHLLARLIGEIGSPLIATPHHYEYHEEEVEQRGEKVMKRKRTLVADLPFERNLAKLWAYCGVGDSTRVRRKGMTAEDAAALGNPRAKTLIWLIAFRAMMQVGKVDPDTGEVLVEPSPYRVVYDQARDRYAARLDWTDGHRHAAAMRMVCKEILRDIWLVAKGKQPVHQ